MEVDLQKKLSSAVHVSTSIDATVLTEIVTTLANTVEEQRKLIDQQNARLEEFEEQLTANAEHDHFAANEIAHLSRDVHNLAHNLQGFNEPDKQDLIHGLPDHQAQRLSRSESQRPTSPDQRASLNKKPTAQSFRNRPSSAAAATDAARASAMAEVQSEAGSVDGSPPEAEDEPAAPDDPPAQDGPDGPADDAVAAEAAAGAEAETAAEAEAAVIAVLGAPADDAPATPQPQPAPGALARQRWRRAIRKVVLSNKARHGTMGLLGTRVAKGMSFAERITRLEDMTFHISARLDELAEQVGVAHSLAEEQQSRPAHITGDFCPAGDFNTLVDRFETVHARLVALGLDEGHLADMHARDAGAVLDSLSTRVETLENKPPAEPVVVKPPTPEPEPEPVPEAADVKPQLAAVQTNVARLAKELVHLAADAEQGAADEEAFKEPFRAVAQCHALRTRVAIAALGVRVMGNQELAKVGSQLPEAVDVGLGEGALHELAAQLHHDEQHQHPPPHPVGLAEQVEWLAMTRGAVVKAEQLLVTATEAVDAFEAQLVVSWGGFSSQLTDLRSTVATVHRAVGGQLADQLAEIKNEMADLGAAQHEQERAMDALERGQRKDSEMEALVKDTVRSSVSGMLSNVTSKQDTTDAQLLVFSNQIKGLLTSKADRGTTEAGLREKASVESLTRVDELIQQFASDLKNASQMTTKQLVAVQKRMERKFIELLDNQPKPDTKSPAVTKSLFTGVPMKLAAALGPGNTTTEAVYDPQTGRYHLPKLGTSRGGGDVFRGGFRMPLEGVEEAKQRVQQRKLAQNMAELRQLSPNSRGSSRHGRQHMWTGKNQLAREGPQDLWRPVTQGHDGTSSLGSLDPPSPPGGGVEPRGSVRPWSYHAPASTTPGVGFDSRLL